MAENPAISINGGYDAAGFPIGVQIVGRRFDDLGVLAMAKAFETLRGPATALAKPAEKVTFMSRTRCNAKCCVADAGPTLVSWVPVLHCVAARRSAPGTRSYIER